MRAAVTEREGGVIAVDRYAIFLWCRPALVSKAMRLNNRLRFLECVPVSDQQPSDSSPQDSSPQPTPRPGQTMSGLHAGYTLAAAVLIGLCVGYGIDHWLESLPWGMVGATAFFIVAGLYQVVKEHS
ncbi:MAG: AtpZ/AtpI family protein [Planctomycetota bacterium]|nr:MAG: AtpZ/AtpI family protein [Planctomycetota bacterium]